MGPFAMSDLAGNDVGWRIRQARRRRAAQRPLHRLRRRRDCELGRFGQKTGAGYYKYNLPDCTLIPDPEVEKIIEETSKKLGITRRAISAQEILERCFYPMINEGAKIWLRAWPSARRHRRHLGQRLRLAGKPSRRPDVVGRQRPGQSHPTPR